MNQSEKAKRFAELHVKGAPLLLYNAWDAGSAKAILAAGAKAIATSSWSVAEAQGNRDGESIPIAFAQQIVARIAATIEAPVIDLERSRRAFGGLSHERPANANQDAQRRDTLGAHQLRLRWLRSGSALRPWGGVE